jgi:hypothetical protein
MYADKKERNKGAVFGTRLLPHSPSAQRSEDWSCPKLNTSSGDKYSEGSEGGGRTGWVRRNATRMGSD